MLPKQRELSREFRDAACAEAIENESVFNDFKILLICNRNVVKQRCHFCNHCAPRRFAPRHSVVDYAGNYYIFGVWKMGEQYVSIASFLLSDFSTWELN